MPTLRVELVLEVDRAPQTDTEIAEFINGLVKPGQMDVLDYNVTKMTGSMKIQED